MQNFIGWLIVLKQKSMKIESPLSTLQIAKQEKQSAIQQVERAIELATRFVVGSVKKAGFSLFVH